MNRAFYGWTKDGKLIQADINGPQPAQCYSKVLWLFFLVLVIASFLILFMGCVADPARVLTLAVAQARLGGRWA